MAFGFYWTEKEQWIRIMWEISKGVLGEKKVQECTREFYDLQKGFQGFERFQEG